MRMRKQHQDVARVDVLQCMKTYAPEQLTEMTEEGVARELDYYANMVVFSRLYGPHLGVPMPTVPTRKPAPAPAKKPAAPQGSTLSKKLATMREAWDEQKKISGNSGGFVETTLTPGRHVCRLVDASIFDSDNGIFRKLTFQCIEGDETGEHGVIFNGVNEARDLMFAQIELRQLGIDVDQLEIAELEDAYKQVKEDKPVVRLSVKVGGDKGQYLNCRIDKLLHDYQGGDYAQVEGGEAAEEEAPAEEEPSEEEAPADEEQVEEVVIEKGDKVSYQMDEKSPKSTGTVKEVYDDNTVEVLDLKSKKLKTVPIEFIELLVD